MQEKKIENIPLGIVGEDTFLEILVPEEKFCILAYKVYYEPPNLADYWKYLARMRWQEEQLTSLYGHLFGVKKSFSKGYFTRLTEKLKTNHKINRLLLGGVAGGLRCIVKDLFRGRINKYYRAMGPIDKEGGNILSEASRSNSAK
jgi:hypothetical protein